MQRLISRNNSPPESKHDESVEEEESLGEDYEEIIMRSASCPSMHCYLTNLVSIVCLLYNRYGVIFMAKRVVR